MYDKKLADAVLETLAEAFPLTKDLHELKRDLATQFSDFAEETWLNSTLALKELGYVQCQFVECDQSELPIDARNIKITRLGLQRTTARVRI